MGTQVPAGMSTWVAIKSPRPLCAAFDRKRFLITDKHTEILDCIPCIMVISHKQSSKQTNTQTDGRYQTYYLPSFAVDKKCIQWINWISTWTKNIGYLLKEQPITDILSVQAFTDTDNRYFWKSRYIGITDITNNRYVIPRYCIVEHTCTYARWALMHRFLSVCHPLLCTKPFIQM